MDYLDLENEARMPVGTKVRSLSGGDSRQHGSTMLSRNRCAQSRQLETTALSHGLSVTTNHLKMLLVVLQNDCRVVHPICPTTVFFGSASKYQSEAPYQANSSPRFSSRRPL